MNTKSKKGQAGGVKTAFLCAAAGAALTVAASFVLAWAAMKSADPQSLTTVMSVAALLAGAILSGALGCRAGKGFVKGLYAGAAFTGLCTLASLCSGGGASGATRLMMFAAAIAGTLIGAAIGKGRKPSAKKRVKKIMGR